MHKHLFIVGLLVSLQIIGMETETGTTKKPISETFSSFSTEYENFTESTFFTEYAEPKKKLETEEEKFFNTIDTLNAPAFAEYITMYQNQIKEFEQDSNNAISAILRKVPYLSIQQSMLIQLFNKAPQIATLLNKKTSAITSIKKTTPLHLVIASLDFSTRDNHHYVGNILELLLKKGANPYTEDDNGINVIEFCYQRGYEALTAYLKHVGETEYSSSKKLKKSPQKSRCIIV